MTAAALSEAERAIIKALLNKGWRNQDIQALINLGRKATVNSGRISQIKYSKLDGASDAIVDAFLNKKSRFNHLTGLCPIDDERLTRAREAMLLAVEIFNTPRIEFKASVFAMLANVAWTYMLHEFYLRNGVKIEDKAGVSLFLSEMIARHDCPLSKGAIKNLDSLKKIRDSVEHKTIGPYDKKWNAIFQASVINFETAITNIFGSRLSLGHELGFAIQFSKLDFDQTVQLQNEDLPAHIAALDAEIDANRAELDEGDIDFQFKVVYTMTSASKGEAHIKFVLPESAEGKDIKNILIKYKPSSELYPLRPSDVVSRVKKETGGHFNLTTHASMWKFFNIRPVSGAKNPEKCKAEYCTYHPAYGTYTYSNKWADFLINHLNSDG